MAHITKFLMDDHSRLKRMFHSYRQIPQSFDLAMDICSEINIHATIEEDLVYPLLENIDPDQAEGAQEEHDEVKELMDEISDMEPGDPELQALMLQLEEAMEAHAEKEERLTFKTIENADTDLWTLGQRAFGRRQELLESNQARYNMKRNYAANSAWGSGVPNAGW